MCVETLALLREEVEKFFGRKILTASDCQYLSKDIYQQTKLQLSLNTLRRVFNLMKSKYQPSLFTLDLLSKYCGYSSFNDFISHKKRASGNNPIQDTGLFNLLMLLFKDSDVRSRNDLTYITLVKEIVNNLEQWPNVIDKFQRQIAKTVNGQRFYFEQFINIDKLNSYYGEGLRFYLREKKTVEAQVLGHSLLCLHNWLIMDDEGVKRHYQEVVGYSINETKHPFTCGRYFATQLYFADVYGYNVEPILTQAKEFYAVIKPSQRTCQVFPCFEYILSEALVLTGQYEEALFYINEALENLNAPMPPRIDVRLFESIYLFQAIALANVGEVAKSKEIMDNLNTKNFYFLSRHFNSILYLLQKQAFQKKELLQKQLHYLVQQTGFKKLIVMQHQEVIEMI